MRDRTKPQHFLIVENDPDDAMLIRMAFHASNCGTSCLCRNASEARAYLRGAGMYCDRILYPLPDAIITDLRMGSETGIDLIKWIREADVLPEVPIIILSGSASEYEMEEAKSLGIYGVYRKPTRVEELKELVWILALKLSGHGSENAANDAAERQLLAPSRN